MMKLFGGIEAGGTKFVCAVGRGPGQIVDEIRFPTGEPEETLGRAVTFFRQHAAQAGLAAVGVACFGPIDPNPASATYGHILATVKPGWAFTDVMGMLKAELGLPVGFDTDVNGAALAEARWGAGQGTDTMVYLTVGTGIGGGAVVDGRLHHGMLHPEMGHMRIPRAPDDAFAGVCAYHGDCWEGLACGPALATRWQASPSSLPADHPAWELEAGYLAAGLHNIVMALSPSRIVVGGGVMEQSHLLPRVRARLLESIAGYVQGGTMAGDLVDYIVPPALGAQAGVLGALALAADAVPAPHSETR